MRFMMLMIPKGYEKAAPGTLPDRKAIEAMMKYNESLQKAGVLLALDGLHPPSVGARVSFAGGKPKVTDGPFSEAKEVLGGYWMIQVKSKEEAIQWASRCPASENEVIELRQVQEFADFPADVQKAARMHIPSIVAGEMIVRNAQISFGDLYIFNHWQLSTKPALLIGMDVLGELDTLVIDYRRNELRIKLPD